MTGLTKQGSNTGLLPSSAAVLDFICLFTHDLKRKQKRWQDGALKYHTFNKRIMVYDDRGHFIGDAHWQAETHLESGDEFELDRGAAIVQVSDCTGQREQDLTELLDKRARDVERRRANATSRVSRPSLHAPASPTQNQSSYFQLRRRPLTDIVGAPSRVGRAVISPHSPYETRQMAQTIEQDEYSRSPKRRKKEDSPPAKSHHARSLFGATLTLTSMTSSHTVRSRMPRDRPNAELKKLLGERDTELQSHTLPSKDIDAQAQRPTSSEKFATPHASDPPQFSDRTVEATDTIRSLSKEGIGQNSHAEQTVVSADDSTTRKPSSKPTTVRIQNKELPQKRPMLQNLLPINGSRIVEESQSIKPILTNTEDAINAAEVTKSVTENGLPRPQQGPRTELRIKSRQRRGLLMVSENRATEPNREKGSKSAAEKGLELSKNPKPEEMIPTTQVQKFPPCQPRTSNAPLTKTCQKDEIALVAATPTSSPPHCSDSNEALDPENSNESAASNTSKQSSNRISKSREEIDGFESAEIQLVAMSDEKPTASRPKTRKKATRYVLSDEELQDTELASHSKAIHASRNTNSAVPRITKMARKSVKSREIIGFTVPNNSLLQFAPAANPVVISVNPIQHPQDAQVGGAKSQAENSNTQEPLTKSTSVTSVSQRVPGCGLDANPTIRPMPRLSNPATRGRKAAKKEDAAGQVPQTIVQLDPAVPPRIGAPKLPSTRTTSTLPGFTNANGGAWSKHAEDLLGMTRPKTKLSRR